MLSVMHVMNSFYKSNYSFQRGFLLVMYTLADIPYQKVYKLNAYLKNVTPIQNRELAEGIVISMSEEVVGPV